MLKSWQTLFYPNLTVDLNCGPHILRLSKWCLLRHSVSTRLPFVSSNIQICQTIMMLGSGQVKSRTLLTHHDVRVGTSQKPDTLMHKHNQTMDSNIELTKTRTHCQKVGMTLQDLKMYWISTHLFLLPKKRYYTDAFNFLSMCTDTACLLSEVLAFI